MRPGKQMITVSLDQLDDTVTLAEDLTLPSGQVLLPRNTVIDEGLRQRLQNRGIDEIPILQGGPQPSSEEISAHLELTFPESLDEPLMKAFRQMFQHYHQNSGEPHD